MNFKNLSSIVLLGAGFALQAQSNGNVGINNSSPTATLHIKSKGATASTQVLKLENADGDNLLTVNDNGTVSGSALTNIGGAGTSGLLFVSANSNITLSGESQMVNITGDFMVTLPANPTNGQLVYIISPQVLGGINANGKDIILQDGTALSGFNYADYGNYRMTLLMYNSSAWYNAF